MSTITREQLHERAREKVMGLELAVTQTAFADSRAELEEELELARIALASLEAEPAGWQVKKHGGDWVSIKKEDVDHYRFNEDLPVREVYTAPPAPVSVPAAMEMDDDFDSAFEHGKAVGWNAYRAAMLQGADGNAPAHFRSRPAQSSLSPAQSSLSPAQGGNSPVIPDTWIPVSDRMPKVGEYVLCLDSLDKHGHFAHDDVYTAAYCDKLSAFTTEYYGDHDWMSKSNPMYWSPMPRMPLPAAPKEVRSALEMGMARYGGAMQKLADGGD